jgi:toxin ParE1/3/4
MMRLSWASEAIHDRGAIYDYIEADNPTAALALDNLFAEATMRLLSHPDLGRSGRVTGTRELVVHPNYIVIYDVVENEIRVLRVLHAAMQWPARKKDHVQS